MNPGPQKKKSEKTKQGRKKKSTKSGNEEGQMEGSKEKNRNISSIILKEFIKFIKENPTEVYPFLQAESEEYLMKTFMMEL